MDWQSQDGTDSDALMGRIADCYYCAQRRTRCDECQANEAALYERWHRWLCAKLPKGILSDRRDLSVEDIVADTWGRLWDTGRADWRERDGDSFPAWLFGRARNELARAKKESDRGGGTIKKDPNQKRQRRKPAAKPRLLGDKVLIKWRARDARLFIGRFVDEPSIDTYIDWLHGVVTDEEAASRVHLSLSEFQAQAKTIRKKLSSNAPRQQLTKSNAPDWLYSGDGTSREDAPHRTALINPRIDDPRWLTDQDRDAIIDFAADRFDDKTANALTLEFVDGRPESVAAESSGLSRSGYQRQKQTLFAEAYSTLSLRSEYWIAITKAFAARKEQAIKAKLEAKATVAADVARENVLDATAASSDPPGEPPAVPGAVNSEALAAHCQVIANLSFGEPPTGESKALDGDAESDAVADDPVPETQSLDATTTDDTDTSAGKKWRLDGTQDAKQGTHEVPDEVKDDTDKVIRMPRGDGE